MMRWLLPLVFALALAIAVVDDPSPRRRPLRRAPAPDGRALSDAALPTIDAALDLAARLDPTARPDDGSATWQRGTFDSATGTLIWFDEIYN